MLAIRSKVAIAANYSACIVSYYIQFRVDLHMEALLANLAKRSTQRVLIARVVACKIIIIIS